MIKSARNYEYFCNEVLKIDNMIRFVGLFVDDEFHSKIQEGKKNSLT